MAIGLIVGFFTTSKMSKFTSPLVYVESNFLKIFINTFTKNFWYIVIIWLMGLIFFGAIITYFIIFFKSFIMGLILGVILKSDGVIGFVGFVRLFLIDLLILVPLLIFIAKVSITNSISSNNYHKNLYLNSLVKITVFTVIYAILKTVFIKIIEV